MKNPEDIGKIRDTIGLQDFKYIEVKMATRREQIHPFLIRLTHWLNFIALGIMVSSGMKIYNASPIFGFKFPSLLTLGGWLAGARQWHFFAMWIFVANGLIWWLYNAISRHGRETTLFQKSDIKGIFPMIKYYLRLEKKHPAAKKYNPLQKLAYTTIPFAALTGILSGIVMYWPVQMHFIGVIFGGYDGARIWHCYFHNLGEVIFITWPPMIAQSIHRKLHIRRSDLTTV